MIWPVGRHGFCPVATGRVTNAIEGQRVRARHGECKPGYMVKAFAEALSLRRCSNYFSLDKLHRGRCPRSGGPNWLWRHRASGRKSSACLVCRSMAAWSPEAFRQNGVADGGMVCTPPAAPAHPLAPLALAAQLLSTAPSPPTWQERLRRCRRGLGQTTTPALRILAYAAGQMLFIVSRRRPEKRASAEPARRTSFSANGSRSAVCDVSAAARRPMIFTGLSLWKS
jgi:hypothetical protein